MDKLPSHKIVRETFEGAFDKDRFVYFCKNLLNKFDTSHASAAVIPIPGAYSDFISKYERIGTYTDPAKNQLDILIVYLQRGTSLERARTAQRNFVARYLKEQDQRDAGLVAFVSPSSTDWRFSLVTMDYKFAEARGGRVKVVEEFTPARRWSFLVGESENSHTAQSQLAPVVQQDEANPTLSELEDAFNIERVTDEFFEQYRDLFLRTNDTLHEVIDKSPVVKAEFTAKHVRTTDFSKQLLGQIIFLYFLQKKGWFGVGRDSTWGTGPKAFIRHLFEGRHGSYENFFNDILEPLFYEALAKERDDDYYARFNCKIPFLNGGLFDPVNDYDWIHADILLPDDLFSNSHKTPEGDTGNGILDVFDRYNFTVKEDEPLEREVAVDPEMLGKVFENLLEVKDRKSQGTYYTPREIVHYMCQRSLINYLVTELDGVVPEGDIDQLITGGEAIEDIVEGRTKHAGSVDSLKRAVPERVRESAKQIDEALANIKICDPAIGSGAFPVGMMSEIVKARGILSPHISNGKRTSYNFKRHCIQNSLYGVDIDPGAVDIAKLRLWLSLVVDEDDIKQIKPLPNLDYKIMQGNSLLQEFEGIQLFDEKMLVPVSLDSDALITELKARQTELQREYFALHSHDLLTPAKQAELKSALGGIADELKRLSKTKSPTATKDGLFDVYSEARRKATELTQLHKEFFGATHKRRKEAIKQRIAALEWELIEATLKEEGKSSELTRLEGLKQTETRPFFLWKLHFAEVFQERGGFDVVIANPPYVGEKGHKEMFREIRSGNLGGFYQGKMDLFYFFFHLALTLGKKDAEIAFITTNYYPTALGARKLRQCLKHEAIIRELVNFNDLKIFEAALGQHNMITILQKAHNEAALARTSITQRQGLSRSELLQTILNRNDPETFYYQVKQKDLYDGDDCYIRWSGTSAQSEDPVQSILEKIKKQGDVLGALCNVNNGIFAGADTLSEPKKTKYTITTANVGDGIFVLTKNEVDKLNLDENEKLIVKPLFKNSDIHRYVTNNNNDLFILNLRYTDRPDIDNYPNIKTHLMRFRALLSNRPRTGTLESAFNNGYWYVMSTSRRVSMDAEKIVVPQRSSTNTFGYNNIPWYAMSDVFFVTEKDKAISLRYILALINSKLYYLWLYHRGKRKGETLELIGNPISEIPIRKMSKDEQKPFIDLVDKILAITSKPSYNPKKPPEEQEELEGEIDKLVYKLYGLTPDEMKIVEGAARKKAWPREWASGQRPDSGRLRRTRSLR
jgi:hypothetical protein